jgi:hypothetical protein
MWLHFMENNSDDNQQLLKFLNQYRPDIPASANNLEDKICSHTETNAEINFQSISQIKNVNNQEITEKTTPIINKRIKCSQDISSRKQKREIIWFATSTIAAGFLTVIFSSNFLISKSNNEVESSNLQNFMESTWYSAMNGKVDISDDNENLTNDAFNQD